jgi:hypothetical protein
MITIEDAVLAINPSAQFTSSPSDNVDGITWLSGTTPISKEDILAKQTELQADYNALDYSRKRAKEYPAVVDQLDDIFHNGIDSWKANIQIIKDKYPKD